MPLTNKKYYTYSDREIPNLGGRTEDAVGNEVNYYIDSREKEVLRKAFGIKMYKDFEQYVDDSGLVPNAPQNYKDIVYGKTYEITKPGTDETFTRYWEGLINEKNIDSLLADYIYCEYWRYGVQKTTLNGDTKNSAKVGNNVSMSMKLSDAWNRFVFKYQGGYSSNYYYKHHNPFRIIPNRLGNGYGVDFCYPHTYYKDSEVSFLVFLSENKESYPLLAEPKCFNLQTENEFGI